MVLKYLRGGYSLAVTISTEAGPWGGCRDDIAVLLRLQNIMLQAAEGERDKNDAEYQATRRALIDDPEYSTL